MADRPSLTSLPAELKGLIVRQCDKAALLSLRIASVGDADLVAEATAECGVRYFTHRKHYISSQGLVSLVNITKHPTLGKFLKAITLVPFELHPYWQPQKVDTFLGPQPGTLQVEHLNRVCMLIWREWLQISTALHHEDASVQILATALRHLRGRAQRVELGTSGRASGLGGVYGGQETLARLNRIASEYTVCNAGLVAICCDDFNEVMPDWLDDTTYYQDEATFDFLAENPNDGGWEYRDYDHVEEILTQEQTLNDACTYGLHTPREAANLVFAALADAACIPCNLTFDCTEQTQAPLS